MAEPDPHAPPDPALERAPLPARDVSRNLRYAAWGITWLSYATYYFGRKVISVTKKPIAGELGETVLVGVDTAYLAMYAIGQSISGFFGDRVGARRLVSGGMLLSAACCALFGASSLAIVFVIAFAVNGLAQSTGWPGNVKAMAEWTPPARRGGVMGVWATCYQVGGIAATGFATFMLQLYGWRGSFWACAGVLALVALIVLLFLRRGPETGRSESSLARGGVETAAEELAERKAAQRALLRQPIVYLYGASYFFIKLIRYSLLFWLPYYLQTVLSYSQSRAGYLSTSFEIGGIVGTILLGWLSDRFRLLSRSGWSMISLLGLALALVLYARVGAISPTLNFAAMALVGALLFGPDALLSGAAAQDAGGPRAAAIAAGLINAIGSLGAILQELVTRGLSKRFGWDGLFYAFVAFAVCAALALVPTFFLKPSAASRGMPA